ncbi:hypothetical protein J3R83DRAFT_6780 [Lanmaoa asiatica]|nr:hypothetical protein J3R83DRAFT_6780 [Lanmaoa asiatica]
MLLISSPIPFIYITPAPPEEIHSETYSPIPSAKPDVEDDGYRAKQLSLPPLARTSPWYSSPLRPADCPPHTGLSRDEFYSLPNVSREQRANIGAQKIPGLPKELALKSQRLKERTVERRARFLSKVKGSPRIAAISILKVSLESPTTAHCSILPHGTESEFSALEVVAENPEHLIIVDSTTNPGWDEQVERGLLITKQSPTSSKFHRAVPKKSRRIPPSLDEITARLKPVHVSSTKDYSQSRLPNFLKASSLSPGSTGDQLKTVPVRSLALNDEKFDTTCAAIYPAS